VWMCAMFTTAVDGKPVSVTDVKFTTAPVTAPEASLDRMRSIVAVPLAVDSAFVIGGFSFAGDSVALNRTVWLLGVEDGAELLDEQPAARRRPRTAIVRRFMRVTLL